MLIEAGAHVNVSTKQGDTPLHLAAQNRHAAVAEVLLAAQAPTEAVTVSGETSSDIAQRKGHVEVAALLR